MESIAMIITIAGVFLVLLSIILSKIIGPSKYCVSLMLTSGMVFALAGIIVGAADGGIVFNVVIFGIAAALIVFCAIRLR